MADFAFCVKLKMLTSRQEAILCDAAIDDSIKYAEQILKIFVEKITVLMALCGLLKRECGISYPARSKYQNTRQYIW